jgi:hypothetical protein
VLFEKISETYTICGVAPQLKISFGEKAGECRVERENVTEIFSLQRQKFVTEKEYILENPPKTNNVKEEINANLQP